ncbi:hypothetical protein F2P81_002666 [Scophthalmus maximus]|uniref:Uncharacterized protein n=1 Tax=Scophthalmus maximus TaxID=52904 RepID=A0A6A4THG7_SCOMX|nr:hypothetical protein F2P81_002666 [Scophthalmus maximus]
MSSCECVNNGICQMNNVSVETQANRYWTRPCLHVFVCVQPPKRNLRGTRLDASDDKSCAAMYCVWALSPLGPSGYFRVPDPPPNRGETPHMRLGAGTESIVEGFMKTRSEGERNPGCSGLEPRLFQQVKSSGAVKENPVSEEVSEPNVSFEWKQMLIRPDLTATQKTRGRRIQTPNSADVCVRV